MSDSKIKEMKTTVVDFSGGGDGITALYLDGKLHKYGDYYHDKIDENIDGFLDGVQYVLGEDNMSRENIQLDWKHPLVKDTWENGNPPPSKLKDIDFEERVTE